MAHADDFKRGQDVGQRNPSQAPANSTQIPNVQQRNSYNAGLTNGQKK